MSHSNLKSILLQVTFIIISGLAVIMLFTCIRHSKIETHTPTELNSDFKKRAAKAIAKSKSQSIDHANSTTSSNNSLPLEHISELNKTLDNNLSLQGVHATKREDGTVIIHSQGKLQTISVARIDEQGNLVFEEHNQSILSDTNKETP